MDSGDFKETQHIESDITQENGELSLLVNKSYGETDRHSDDNIEGNTENNEMDRLVAAE
jgi:hypothetical protein